MLSSSLWSWSPYTVRGREIWPRFKFSSALPARARWLAPFFFPVHFAIALPRGWLVSQRPLFSVSLIVWQKKYAMARESGRGLDVFEGMDASERRERIELFLQDFDVEGGYRYGRGSPTLGLCECNWTATHLSVALGLLFKLRQGAMK